MNILSRSVIVFALFVLPSLGLAYNPSINDTTIPYEVFVADGNVSTQAEYLGELIGEPQMYEINIGAESTLKLSLSQANTKTAIPFSLIAVKQNTKNAGVVEIGRIKSKDVTWDKYRDPVLGMSLLNSQVLEVDVTPGLYRVEVSTPENFGKYMLVIGDGKGDAGYFKTLGHVDTIRSFFNKSTFTMFLSSYVYYPIGILILSYLFYTTWKRRKLITNQNA